MERAEREMTTLHDDGVYYALTNEEEYSSSYPSPKPASKNNNDDSTEYVTCS